MPGQRGHAVAFTLALLACLAVAALLVYDSGRLVAQKRRLFDAADSAALSAAMFEARVLNFEGYMNRAIVANQVAMAQSVSLRSWLDYMTRTVDRANRVTRFVPYLGAATNTLRNVMAGVNRVAQRLLVAGEGNNEIALSVVMTAGVAIALAASLASASSGRGDGVAPA